VVGVEFVPASQGFRAFHSAWRTLQGIETMNMIRKGQVRWIEKGDMASQAMFVEDIELTPSHCRAFVYAALHFQQ
jgi:hypothetical protein